MTDGIRLLALNDNGVTVDVTETFEPVDDGFTGETMETTSEKDWSDPCPPGSECPACASEREQAIRLAEEALEVAKRTTDLATRREKECQIALLELTGEDPLYANLLQAQLSGNERAIRVARVEFYADLFLRNSTPPPLEIADAVTERVAALRILSDKH